MTKIEESQSEIRISDLEKPSTFRDALSGYTYHWPVYIVSSVLLVSIAFLYLRYAPKSFVVSSTLLIKDEKKGSLPSGGDLLNELDLFGSSKVVENEIEILKSKALMRKVVDRLSLAVSLNIEGRLKNSDLYSSKMLSVSALNMNKDFFGKRLQLRILNKSSYEILDNESGFKFQGTFDKLERNKLGVFQINKGVKFQEAIGYPLSLIISDPIALTDQILNELNVELASKQSTVLNLSILSSNPEKGQSILNTLVQVYNEEALFDKNRTTQSTMLFIDERLKLITGELTGVEKDVQSFKSTRGITNISTDANIFLENVKVNDAKLNEVNLQISVINDINNYLNSTSSNEKLPSTLGINDAVLLGQITQLSELQLQRDQLLATTTVNNPLVAPLQNQIVTTRAGIKATINNIRQSLQVSKENLQNNNSEFQSSIKKIPEQERQLVSIERQKTIKESLYLYLLQKKEEAALSYAASVADSRTVDEAFFSQVPMKPNDRLVYIAAILFSLILPTGYIYGKTILNNKVEGVGDLTKLTSAPLLGEIMFSEEFERIVVQANSRKGIAEQFRAIRTNLQFLHGSKRNTSKGNVTLFTSGMSGEGKSFVAINLGAALAIAGKRTVLLELDLRKPKVSKYLGMNNQIGLSNYLIGSATRVDIIKETNVHSNFFVIGSGPIPPNPSELLIESEIEDLLEYLKDNFDEILIDTPPIGLVTDAQILGRLADATIYIVRQNVTFKRQVDNLDYLYRLKKLPKINVILNGIKAGSANYGYGYGYYSDDALNDKNDLASIFKNILKRF